MESSAGLVLYRRTEAENLFLLLKYPAGHWDFVKGHVESGETAREAAIRELYEETGIEDAVFVNGFRRRIKYTYRYGGRTRFKRVVFFLAHTGTEKVRISEEHQTYMWCSYARSLKQVTFRNARYVLGSARRFVDSQEQ